MYEIKMEQEETEKKNIEKTKMKCDNKKKWMNVRHRKNLISKYGKHTL